MPNNPWFPVQNVPTNPLIQCKSSYKSSEKNPVFPWFSPPRRRDPQVGEVHQARRVCHGGAAPETAARVGREYHQAAPVFQGMAREVLDDLMERMEPSRIFMDFLIFFLVGKDELLDFRDVDLEDWTWKKKQYVVDL